MKAAFSNRLWRVGYLLGGVGWVTANCRKILWGVFERRRSKISRRQLSKLLAEKAVNWQKNTFTWCIVCLQFWGLSLVLFQSWHFWLLGGVFWTSSFMDPKKTLTSLERRMPSLWPITGAMWTGWLVGWWPRELVYWGYARLTIFC